MNLDIKQIFYYVALILVVFAIIFGLSKVMNVLS